MAASACSTVASLMLLQMGYLGASFAQVLAGGINTALVYCAG